ncbi:MAG: Maf family protein [Mobilitalea sp.]
MYQIILASESPRRKEIMETMGIPYRVMTGNVEEVAQETVPAELVQALARLKTDAISSKLSMQSDEQTDVIIIGADTMVFYMEHALGKPKDEEDAVRILQMLSNNVHEVYTGVSIIIRNKEGIEDNFSFAVSTKVVVQAMTTEQIMSYVATGEPMDKAGAYAIQGKFGIYIKEIVGDYYNVVGFPIAKIYEMLLRRGIDIKK